MQMRIKRAIAAASVVVAAAATGAAGPTAAGATTAASTAARSGTEHFQLMSTSATSNKASFIARGVFTAGGVDTENNTDHVKLPGGGFVITHKVSKGTQHFDPKTCLGVIHQVGTYKLSKGTGRYAGIRGHGKFSLRILLIGARTSAGKCSKNKPPTTFQQLITASGPVTLK